MILAKLSLKGLGWNDITLDSGAVINKGLIWAHHLVLTFVKMLSFKTQMSNHNHKTNELLDFNNERNPPQLHNVVITLIIKLRSEMLSQSV